MIGTHAARTVTVPLPEAEGMPLSWMERLGHHLQITRLQGSGEIVYLSCPYCPASWTRIGGGQGEPWLEPVLGSAGEGEDRLAGSRFPCAMAFRASGSTRPARYYGGPTAGAILSADQVYRYLLWRVWDEQRPGLVWLMLNPSTADHEVDDPTIRRCIGFAKRRQMGSITVINLFALRATNPQALVDHTDPRGPDNAYWQRLAILGSQGGMVAAAWGAHAKAPAAPLPSALREAMARRQVYCLGKTKAGAPKHPLYLRTDQPFEVWP